MKMFKKSIALLIVIVMVLAAVPAAFAVDCLAGNSVTVSLNLGKGYGIDGHITVNDPDGIISKISFTGPAGYDGFIEPSGSGYATYYSKINVSSAGDCVITAKVTLKNEESKAGKSATISFSGTTSQASDGSFADVAASTSVKVTMTKPAPEVKIDYTELEKQIGVAEDLNKGDYTADSWTALEDALANAKNHLTSKNQTAVDKAASDLAAAIAALVAMDYSKLEEALNNANAFINEDAISTLWKDFVDAIQNGTGLLGSGDQAAVDAAADSIQSLLDALKQAIAEALEGDAGEEDGCEHDGLFCNIPIHKLWPILFFISLAGNIALIVVIVVKKKKEEEKK